MHQHTKTILPQVLALALPLSISQLMIILSNFICMLFIARLGHQVIAASGLIVAIQSVVMVIAFAIFLALGVLIGKAHGEKNYLQISSIYQHGLYLAFAITGLLIIFTHYLAAILHVLQQPENLIPIIEKFFLAHNWRLLPFFIAVCNQQYCYAVRKQRYDVIANCVGIVVLLISARVMILGTANSPALGVVGFAYALTLQAIAYASCTTLLLLRDTFTQEIGLFQFPSCFNRHTIAAIIRLGFPITLQMGLEMSMLAAIATMLGWLGADALAAFQITNQYALLVIVPTFSIAQACAILISQHAQDSMLKERQSILSISQYLIISICCIAGSIFLFFPGFLANLYINAKQVQFSTTLQLTRLFFAFTAFSRILDSSRNLYTAALRGLLDTRYPLIIGMITILGIGIPLSYFLGFVLDWHAKGIFTGNLVCLSLSVWALHQRWQKKNTLPLLIAEKSYGNSGD